MAVYQTVQVRRLDHRRWPKSGGLGELNVGAGPGSREGQYVDWLTISDQAQSVLDDVTRIRNHPLVPSNIPIYGYIYEVTTGRLVEVPAATSAGAAGS